MAIAGFSLGGADAGNYLVLQPAGVTASITAAALTGTITADNRPYNGTTAATVHGSLAGLLGSDVVSLNVTSAAFADKHAGAGKSVTAALSLGGADAANYTVNPTAAATATITPVALAGTITADSKVYDGTVAATAHGSLGAGVVTGDVVSLLVSNAVFADPNVGTAKTVTASLSLTGADAGSYTVNATAVATADITTPPVAAQFVNPVNGATNIVVAQPIQWTTITGAQAYYLYVGTTLGAKDLINTGETQLTSWPASTLPAGITLYARIWTKLANVWRYNDITFTASALRATMITPASGAANVDPAGMLEWTSVPAAQKYLPLRRHDARREGSDRFDGDLQQRLPGADGHLLESG